MPKRFAQLFPGSVEEMSQKPVDAANPIVDFRWNGFAVRVGLTTEEYVSGNKIGSPMERCRLEAGLGGDCVPGPDGSAMDSTLWTGPAVDGGVSSRAVTVFTADGWTVTLMAHNAGDSKSSEVLADHPPFSIAELQRAATSDVWFE